MPTKLPHDLPRLRSELPAALEVCGPALVAGARWAWAAIDDAFGDQAIERVHARAINELIAPHVDAVLSATDPPGRHRALDDLIAAWNQLAPQITRLT